MTIAQMDTTKEGIKNYLDQAATALKCEWHSQQAHKAAIGLWMLDLMKVENQSERDQFWAQWGATPSSFGTNASALGQALGRTSSKTKLESTFAGM